MARTVYSSGPDGARPVRDEPERTGEPQRSLPREQQRVHVRIVRAGRGGKTVTLAGPLELVRAEAASLLQDLKKACGGGGTLKAGTTPGGAPAFVLELQGDHVARLPALLRERGFLRAR
jgi:translation initiation factor 1